MRNNDTIRITCCFWKEEVIAQTFVVFTKNECVKCKMILVYFCLFGLHKSY